MEPFIRPALDLLSHPARVAPLLRHTPDGTWNPAGRSDPGGDDSADHHGRCSRDSLNRVPTKLRQAAYGVGTTPWGAIMSVILPAAVSGIVGGVMLALGRAMGETMAVTMIIGNSNNFNRLVYWHQAIHDCLHAGQPVWRSGRCSRVSSRMYAAFVLDHHDVWPSTSLPSGWSERLSLKY